LRQANFQAEDLGLDPLNRPAAYSGFATTVALELPLFAPEGLYQHAAARRGANARHAGVERAVETMSFMVVRAYWNVQLASAELRAIESALAAARAHAEQAEAFREQGLVTGLDARLARVRAAELETRLIATDASAANARSALAVLLGMDVFTEIELTDSLTQAKDSSCLGSNTCDVSARSDLVASRLGVDAANLAVRAAVASNLPSIAAFGALSRYGRTSPWGEGSGDWTVGIGVTWSPFRALSGIGAVRRARAERDAVVARLEAAENQARLEVISAERMLVASAEQVVVAQAAREEAVVALEQARLRYSAGTAPVTEFLDVQAASVAAELNLLSVRRQHAVARAALDFAYGAFDQ